MVQKLETQLDEISILNDIQRRILKLKINADDDPCFKYSPKTNPMYSQFFNIFQEFQNLYTLYYIYILLTGFPIHI